MEILKKSCEGCTYISPYDIFDPEGWRRETCLYNRHNPINTIKARISGSCGPERKNYHPKRKEGEK